eukprot:SAG31_NODE_1173_length_9543_cov_8.654913_1_plen_103_part_10
MARTLDVLQELTPVSFASATRGLHQGVAQRRKGRLLSTLGPLGRLLHSHAQENEGALPHTTVPVKLLAFMLNLARYCTGLRWYLGLVLQPISCWYRRVPCISR